MEKLKSRKLWATIAGVLAVVASVLANEVSVADAVNKVVLLVLGYVGVQGFVDSKK